MAQLAELLTYMDGVRKRMDVVVARTDPTLELCPGWTIKEAISHITAWEIVIHKSILVYKAGDPPYFLREQDFDRFNAQAVHDRIAWSLEKVLREWKDVRMELRQAIKSLAEGDLEAELVLPWGSERTMAELIEIIGEHEEEHLENILKSTG